MLAGSVLVAGGVAITAGVEFALAADEIALLILVVWTVVVSVVIFLRSVPANSASAAEA